MAPVLPLNCSGDFGTSPFIGQLSGKPRLAYNSQVALPHPEHNSSSKRLSVSVTVDSTGCVEFGTEAVFAGCPGGAEGRTRAD
jgi:hypothetical protein